MQTVANPLAAPVAKLKVQAMTTWVLEARSNEADDNVLTILRKFFMVETLPND